MKKNNSSIDVVKGICIVFVIITHFSWAEGERLRLLFPFWIEMAVPIFMALSGYVCAKSFLRRNMNALENAYEPTLILQRILRFAVPFVICFGIEVTLDLLQAPRESLFNVIARFFRGGYGPGGYYFPIMIQFIFLFPIIFFIIKKYNHYGLLACGILNVLYEIIKVAWLLNEECYRFLVFRYIFIISYGCYLGMEERKHKWRTEFIVSSIGFLYLLSYFYWGVQPQIFIYWTGTSCIATLFVLPFIRYVTQRAKVHCAFVELCGRSSLNIYLVQMTYYAFEDIWGIETGNPYMDIGLIILICICLGILFYILSEWLNKIILSRCNLA